MKSFVCDKCKKEFGGPLDEEKYLDEHGVSHTFDLCALCRQDLEEAKNNAPKKFFEKIMKE